MKGNRHSVVGKVQRILDALAGSDGVLGLSELARRSELPKSTTHRICGELVDWGVVERSGDAFRLGSRLFELGSRVPGRRLFRDTALPIIEDLSTATGQTVHLAVLEGTEVMYVERLPGRAAAEVPSSVAGRLPLHCTATGRCLLAHGPGQLTERVFADDLEPRTEHSVTGEDELRTILDVVREDGIAIERSEVSIGFMSVAAPVFELGDRIVGAISVTGAIDSFDVAGVTELTRRSAKELSRRFGATVH